jgi:hypothetical protein
MKNWSPGSISQGFNNTNGDSILFENHQNYYANNCPLPSQPEQQYHYLIRDLPFNQVQKRLRSFSFTMQDRFDPGVDLPLLSGIRVTTLSDIGESISHLRSLFPATGPGEMEQMILDLEDPALFHNRVTEIIMCHLSNNFNCLWNYNLKCELAKCFETTRPLPLLRLFFQGQGLAFIAVISQLLDLAIIYYTHGAILLHLFIDAGLDKKHLSGLRGVRYVLQACGSCLIMQR